MSKTSSEFIKDNFVFNYVMFILDSFGFGAAFALMIPLSYTPDVAFEISSSIYAPPLIIILFYLLNIFGQVTSSIGRKKEQDSKYEVIKWGLVERLGIILIFISLKYFLASELSFLMFLITYSIFVFSSGAILPAYFDLVSRVLYKYRSIFFAINLTTGSAAGYFVSKYVDTKIQSNGLISGFQSGVLIVIFITSFSLIPLLLIREPNSTKPQNNKFMFTLLNLKIQDWKNLYYKNIQIKAIARANFVSVLPESVTPFFSIWLISEYNYEPSKIGIWVTLLLLSQGIGSFFVPIFASKFGFKYTYIMGLIFHFLACVIFIFFPLNLQNFIFIFAGLGAGALYTSQSNISVEIGKLGEAGNTNTMLTMFKLPGLLLAPFLFAFFSTNINLNYLLLAPIFSSAFGIFIMFYQMKDKIKPQVRFWLKDA
ncbi:MAG: MFS transporter [Actinomycetota bacterium]|nr:MFS transporter [Actinomycetota bacterium]MDA3013893.1 MFS transporter [Actinomycetota bacterium]